MKIRRIIALLVLACMLTGCGAMSMDAMESINGMAGSSDGNYGGIYDEFAPGEAGSGAQLSDQKGDDASDFHIISSSQIWVTFIIQDDRALCNGLSLL